MQLGDCSVLDVICLQQSTDRISKSHSADNTAVTQSGIIEGIFYTAVVSLTEKTNNLHSTVSVSIRHW